MKSSGKRVDWSGCGTALVTPFDDKGRIAFGRLEELVDWQISQGIDFLVPCGTTGESPTLSRDERKAVTAAVVRAANGRVPVIAGAGGNHTARAVFWASEAAAAEADGIVSVTPMYNQPSPDGLVRHFSAIAEATDLPMIVYNTPVPHGVRPRRRHDPAGWPRFRTSRGSRRPPRTSARSPS